MHNNIKKILEEQGISINRLSEMIDLTYPATHRLVNRDSLSATPIGTLIKVAESLGVELEDLYKE